jgi:hypothetical protein
VTIIASDAAKLRELDQDTQRAWTEYREKTQALTGLEYEHVELEAWTELATELHRLERRRELMLKAAA